MKGTTKSTSRAGGAPRKAAGASAPRAASTQTAPKQTALPPGKIKKVLDQNSRRGKPGFRKAYGFALVTGALFLTSWVGQFVTQLMTVRNENADHGQPFEWPDFIAQFLASTFENWQSEFLQLVWQAAGLSLLLFWGSSQSRESDERIEAKLDQLLAERGLDPAVVSESVNRAI